MYCSNHTIPKNGQYKKLFGAVLVTLSLGLIIGCAYYRTATTEGSEISHEDLYKKLDPERRFYLHQAGWTYRLKGVSVQTEAIVGVLDTVSAHEILFSPHRKKGRMRASQSGIVNEIHIYLPVQKPSFTLGERVHIPFDKIQTVDVVESDDLRAIAPIFGLVVGTVVLVAAMRAYPGPSVSSSEGSCPYVYVMEDDVFKFEGEIFSGAILHNMEQDDYLKLGKMDTPDDNYVLRLSNELPERQYVNLAELVTVEHPVGLQVHYDRHGQLLSMRDEILPVKAIAGDGADVRSQISKKDSMHYTFNKLQADTQTLHLFFRKPTHISEATLLVRGKNSTWSDYLYGGYLRMFGKKFDTWKKRATHIAREKRMDNIAVSGLPLTVYVRRNGTWEVVDHFNLAGPASERDMVMRIDLSGVAGDSVEIKLQTGFLLWDVNYVAIDYSEQAPVTTQHIPVRTAESLQEDALDALAREDDQYLMLPDSGTVADLRFSGVPGEKKNAHSFFLHTRGYYEPVRDFDEKSDIGQIKKFRAPGYFNVYSKEMFYTMMHPDDKDNTTEEYE